MTGKDRLLQYLPPLYANSQVVGAVLEAAGAELGLLRDALDQVLEQQFVPTATWGLEWWEASFGLPPGTTLALEDRRARVLSKRRGTSARLLLILRSMAPGLEARFGGDIITFVLPVDHPATEFQWGALVPEIELRKPAHKAYAFEILPPDSVSGYAALGEHRTRYRVHLVPEAGSLRSGRWPHWTVRGAMAAETVMAAGEQFAGVADWPRVATWPGPSPGTMAARTVTVVGARYAGAVTYRRCGTFRVGEVA